MNVNNPDLVIVRGINSDFFEKNFSEFRIGFGGSLQATPKEDAFYVGLYIGAPVSSITHIGIVERIDRHKVGVDFYLKTIIKLQNPIVPNHTIRKHENWELSQFGFSRIQMENFRLLLNNI